MRLTAKGQMGHRGVSGCLVTQMTVRSRCPHTSPGYFKLPFPSELTGAHAYHAGLVGASAKNEPE